MSRAASERLSTVIEMRSKLRQFSKSNNIGVIGKVYRDLEALASEAHVHQAIHPLLGKPALMQLLRRRLAQHFGSEVLRIGTVSNALNPPADMQNILLIADEEVDRLSEEAGS